MAWALSGKPGPTGWVPWIVWTEWVVNHLYLTHEGPYTEKEKASLLGWATSTAILFAIPQIVSRAGLGVLGWFGAVYYAGKWTSQAIDPDEGHQNFHGFISGGIYGNDPDYGSAQRPGSGGYFDVPGNIALILLDRGEKAAFEKAVEEEQKLVDAWQAKQDARKILYSSFKTIDDFSPEQRVEMGFWSVSQYEQWFDSQLPKIPMKLTPEEILKIKRLKLAIGTTPIHPFS